MSEALTLKPLKADWINSENFKPYGQFIKASADGKPFDQEDAQLNLSQGIPRFYIMRLEQKGCKFSRITRHEHCTQCLGSLDGKDWLMAVAPPAQNNQPDLEKLAAFRIPSHGFIKLEVGTWHAGPYFNHEFVDFYNLELSDTNIVDHFTHDFSKSHQLKFEIVI